MKIGKRIKYGINRGFNRWFKNPKRVKPLVNGKGWDYTVLLDINQEFKRAMGISNVPYLIVVKMVKLFYWNGHTPGGETELFEKLKNIK